jgi:ribonuclease P protein subunit POP4
MQKPTNITKHELIGLDAEITKSRNCDLVGLNGTVVDETRETIKIRTHDNNEKIIIKNQTKFKFRLPGGEAVEVDGTLLVGRPETRIKKQTPKKRV